MDNEFVTCMLHVWKLFSCSVIWALFVLASFGILIRFYIPFHGWWQVPESHTASCVVNFSASTQCQHSQSNLRQRNCNSSVKISLFVTLVASCLLQAENTWQEVERKIKLENEGQETKTQQLDGRWLCIPLVWDWTVTFLCWLHLNFYIWTSKKTCQPCLVPCSFKICALES